MTIGMAATLGLQAIRLVLLSFRPEEQQGLARWYIDNIRIPLERTSGWQFPLNKYPEQERPAATP
jgi:hypothetical protein